MGCGSSKELEKSDSLPPIGYDNAQSVDDKETKRIYQRLRKLQELDEATKVPFILIELTGEGDGEGEIEVCGKDEYGIYESLDGFLLGKWECEKLDPGSIDEDTKVPFCQAAYRWNGFKTSGEEGLNNMGLMTMRIVDFVCSQCSWTLAVVNGGNIGQKGEVRETQLIFKSPHPMNLVSPHMMIEIRSAGYIEVCADMEEVDLPTLAIVEDYITDRFQAEVIDGHEQFCDRYYKAGDGVFKGSSGSLDSNFGLLCVEVCDKVATIDGWSLVACNSGNYGETGEHCEQQLVFRRDYHPLGKEQYIQVILNGAGNIEVNGQKNKEIHGKLNKFLTSQLRCKQAGEFWENTTMCRRYEWRVKDPDMLRASADVTSFFEQSEYELQVCAQQMIREDGQSCRETQMLFRKGKTASGTIEPHMFLELYTGEGSEELYEDEEKVQVLANQRIRLRAIGSIDTHKIEEAKSALHEFICVNLGGGLADDSEQLKGTIVYKANVFLCRGRFENNLAQWTMRMCDFMVDRLGWNFVVCSLCNMGDFGQYRSQQLVFHYDGEKRAIPLSMKKVDADQTDGNDWESIELPSHWTHLTQEEVVARQAVHKTKACSEDEKIGLQSMLDASFKRVLTRDRRPDDEAPDNEEMPYRCEIVHVFRSEHAWLHYRYCKRRADIEIEETFPVKTAGCGGVLDSQLAPGDSYLFHGTNPSSAMNILKTGFVLDHAGHTTGTMYGAGVYMAECSSKSDEYSRDDGGNTYPSLHAILVCKCFVGVPLVVDSSGDHTDAARKANLHSVCGDRESKVGTYREFIFFNEAQVYPEYAIIYRRIYDAEEAPEHMRVKATGTTGRAWQHKTESGWKNLPMEITKQLNTIAAREGEGDPTYKVTLGGSEFEFNVETKIGTNLRSGKTVPIRAPMVK
mmetsp:Transcript_53672/g.85372  ORF Transcript_53672/g.85372 Transcript_53672/m.85372 type:complete len:907 (+) Transcript_53672:44-2764(+)